MHNPGRYRFAKPHGSILHLRRDLVCGEENIETRSKFNRRTGTASAVQRDDPIAFAAQMEGIARLPDIDVLILLANGPPALVWRQPNGAYVLLRFEP